MTILPMFVLVATLCADDLVVENFEAYKPGQIIGKNADSKPWQRFGKATNDNVVATGNQALVISDKRSGHYGMTWPNPFGAVRCVLEKPIDASTMRYAVISIRSDRKDTPTYAKLRIGSGETTWESLAGSPLSNKASVFFFSLAADNMRRTDGKADHQDVITHLETIGLTFTSSKDQANETVYFDDFVLTEKEPKPNEE